MTDEKNTKGCPAGGAEYKRLMLLCGPVCNTNPGKQNSNQTYLGTSNRAARRRPYASTSPKSAFASPLSFSMAPERRNLFVGALVTRLRNDGGKAICLMFIGSAYIHTTLLKTSKRVRRGDELETYVIDKTRLKYWYIMRNGLRPNPPLEMLDNLIVFTGADTGIE